MSDIFYHLKFVSAVYIYVVFSLVLVVYESHYVFNFGIIHCLNVTLQRGALGQLRDLLLCSPEL